jgi:predicted house-cleaning noncanonical NTP pyrophosphatase (MazG superfamily)
LNLFLSKEIPADYGTNGTQKRHCGRGTLLAVEEENQPLGWMQLIARLHQPTVIYMSYTKIKQILLDLEVSPHMTFVQRAELQQIFESKLKTSEHTRVLVRTEREQLASLLELLAAIARGNDDENTLRSFLQIILKLAHGQNSIPELEIEIDEANKTA